MPLEELVLCRNQHVTGQAVCGFYLLKEVLLAYPCDGSQSSDAFFLPQQGPHIPATLKVQLGLNVR
jgi:hypothetical protein